MNDELTTHLRICLISYDIQEFGGLEEYAVNLAIGLKHQGYEVSYLSAAWARQDNQYVRRLKANDIPLFQPPEWLSKPVSDWATKEKILHRVMWFLSPLTFLLGIGVCIIKRRSIERSLTSAHNWLKGHLMDRFIGPDRRKWLGLWLLNVWRYCWHPDVLHIQGYTTSLLFAIEWAYAKKIAVVYEEHQTPDAQFDWWKNFSQTINKSKRVVAVSEKSADALREVCGVTRPIVVRSPLMPDPFESGWRRDHNHMNGKLITVTTIARLYVTKGLNYLLEAAALVKADYPEVQFKVYGDGEMRDDLLDQARQLGLDGEGIFVGAFTDRRELTRIMSETDIFLLSSVLEGQPLVIVEAMANGCPIVSTAVGGIPELIQDGLNGLLCKSGDPECLAQKIRMLIEEPILRAEIRHRGAPLLRTGIIPGGCSQRATSIYLRGCAPGWRINCEYRRRNYSQ